MFRFGETLRLRFDIIATPANSSTVYDDTHSGIDSFIPWCRRHLATCKIAPRDTCRDEVQILEAIIIFPCGRLQRNDVHQRPAVQRQKVPHGRLSDMALRQQVTQLAHNMAQVMAHPVFWRTRSAAYHPEVLLSLLDYDYAIGTFSNRKIERAVYDSLAFFYLAAGSHPDHDTLASFRRLRCA